MARREGSHHLFKLIKEGLVPPERLNNHERKCLVQFLRLESNMTFNKIAEFLRLNVRTVKKYAAQLREHSATLYGPIETMNYARRMIGLSNELQERARAKNDVYAEWKIEKEKLVLLGRMGLIEFKCEPPPPPPAGPTTVNGDVVMGNKLEVNQQNNVRQVVQNLDPAEREKLAAALEFVEKAILPAPTQPGDEPETKGQENGNP